MKGRFGWCSFNLSWVVKPPSAPPWWSHMFAYAALVVWFNQHHLPRGGGCWFVAVTPSLRRSKLPHVFPTSHRRPLVRRRLQVCKGRVVVLHPVLWVVGGGFGSCRILAVFLRVGELEFLKVGVFLSGINFVGSCF
ncbi:hypothetical protein QL285_083439 [Trifolium repens]|nr:hypothetical protein QL285_083439 [Trifolium repens]